MPLIDLENLSRFKTKLDATYGTANNPAKLDNSGKIPQAQLPSEVYSIVTCADYASFPQTGEENKIYIDLETNNQYRWDTTEQDYIILTTELPSNVFNVVTYATYNDFPQTGEDQKIYIDRSTNNQYRWDTTGEEYISLSSPDVVKYIQQSLTAAQKEQARTNIAAVSYEAGQTELTAAQKQQARINIGAADSSVNTAISELQAAVQVLGENVSDVTKIENGIRISYGNNTSKDIEIESDFPIDSVVYDENYFLHFYDKTGNDLFDPVYIQGGGGGGSVGSVTVTRITDESVDIIYGKPMEIEFSVEALDSGGDLATLKGATWSIDGMPVARNVAVGQGYNKFDIGPYLNAGTNIVRVSVAADTGGSVDLTGSKTWRINAVNMRFVWNYNDAQINTDAFNDTWTVYGDVLKTTHTRIGENELPTTETTKTGATQSIQMPMQEHGAYGVEKWLTATIGGEPKSTDIQYHEMIFVEAGNMTPIIAISKNDLEMDQYDTMQIPIVIYDPASVFTNATLYIDNELVTTWENIDRSVQYWYYTPTTKGTHTLGIRCGTTLREIEVIVNEVQLDIEEVAGYTFKFKSSEFASNSAVRAWNSNGITASFSNNFDWVNGGLHTEYDSNRNLQQYFCIKSGTRMTINYKLFGDEDPKSRGMTFKIIYKTKNCRDYDAEIANCYALVPKNSEEEQEEEEFVGIGIRMFAHNASFESSGTSISVPYGEDEYSELEFDVYPSSNYRYMMAWMDGVITTCRVYDSNDFFMHTEETAKNIVIGSDDCDVYLYMVKAYPFLVDRDGHIDNFIMDASNASEMANRYKRNNITGEDGSINYNMLIQNNPDCRVWLYDMAYLPNSKDDKVGKDDPSKRAKFYQFWDNGDQYYQIEGTGIMSIQGTSSVDYIRGAANTDINFTELKDGNNVNLMANGTKDETYGNNWFVEDPNNPNHAKIYTVLDAKIDVGIRRTYTVAQALTIAQVQTISELGPEWVVYEEDDQHEPVLYVNTNDTDGEGTIGPEFVVVERGANRVPTKYIKALGLKLNDDSCPITYSNTKVNFASCEQVNNMCNAIWYQRYNPYPSLTARDCMEFNMGVQFIKDSGQIPDDKHFVLWGDGKYHMYSIANMGTSKKNVHIFHDLSNVNECCIEVNNNTNDLCRMITAEGFDSVDWTGKVEGEDHSFGMRYPDVKTPSEPMRLAWKRFVTWMATCNPTPYDAVNNPTGYTGEQLSSSETYDEYTFRGHDRDGNQVLRGTKVTQYAGTYTHDTFERRMAKMLSECEDYMVMDSVIYHYVYIERHTMMDNVAKNTFWSSTDLLHWDLSKAYDMDTSDGNNNEGRLVFDYGNEYNDDVFNADDAVWFVFAANLFEACQTMFINRESAGAWSASAYHNFLLSEQRKVPERCWVQCYWYDYLRTYEQNINSAWMSFLDGGQKTHQRNHYETFEETYDSSKYRGSACRSSNMTLRCYTPDIYGGNISNESGAPLKSSTSNTSTTLATMPKDSIISIFGNFNNTDWYRVTYNDKVGYVRKTNVETLAPKNEISLKMYNKVYAVIDLDGNIKSVKADRGTTYTIDFSDFGKLGDTVLNIYSAHMVQEMSGIANLYPGFCSFSNGIRLRSLAVGSDVLGYSNTNLDEEIALTNNTMLEYLYVQNLPNANVPLNLSNSPFLLYVDATGSGFTAYTFAKGGLLEEAKINRPTSLTLINTSNITTEHFVINNASNIVALRLENLQNLDTLSIVNRALSLQAVRLINIDWIMQNTSPLDRMLKLRGLDEDSNTIAQSVLVGTAYTPSIRARNLREYSDAWGTDLVVTYDNEVQEYIISFENPDGSVIKDRLGKDYIQYVDNGQEIIDPVESGAIDTPTMASTAEFDYTFTGWANITGNVYSDRTVIATYSEQTRTYRVRWLSQTNSILKTIDVPYGTEALYQDENHTFPPTKTDEEENFYFWVFKGWDKSTGFITENTDVMAIWDRATLPSVGTQMKNMSVSQIYGIAKKYLANERFDYGDYTDITVGRDFNFSNVESQVLLQNRYFDGTEILKCDGTNGMPLIKLFNAEAPSFTLAIDYEFTRIRSNDTLVSCCDDSGESEGFRVYCDMTGSGGNTNKISVIWGDRTDTVGYNTNRSILVLKHQKGSKNLFVASNNDGRYIWHYGEENYGGDNTPNSNGIYRYDGYNPDIHWIELPRAQDTSTDSVLSFGAMAFGTQGKRYEAQGWIHWCKIWYEDLGQYNMRELACWPHETWRMQYRGNGLYNKTDGTGLRDGASFIASAPLPMYYEMYTKRDEGGQEIDPSGGWRESAMRAFVNSKCFNALPYEWQAIVQSVSISTKGGKDNPEVVENTSDKIYIPSYADMFTVDSGYIAAESTRVPWFVESSDRVKFMGINIPDNSQIISSADDPTLYSSYNVKEYDIWNNTSNSRYYIYLSQNTASKHNFIGGRYTDDTLNNVVATGSQGGLWVRSTPYWTRTNAATRTGAGEYEHYTITNTGTAASVWIRYDYYERRSPVLMFSI